jgi:hypothetical protein
VVTVAIDRLVRARLVLGGLVGDVARLLRRKPNVSIIL